MKRILTPLVVILLMTACSSDRNVVQSGLFQHRKYVHPGWFLGTPRTAQPLKQRAAVTGEIAERTTPSELPADRAIQEPFTAVDNGGPVASELRTDVSQASTRPSSHRARAERTRVDRPVDKDADVSATAGLDAGLFAPLGASLASVLEKSVLPEPTASGDDVEGVNIFALLGFIFAFIFPIAGLVLSIIGLHRTSPHDGHGHGLALAGLIISIVFIIAFVSLVR